MPDDDELLPTNTRRIRQESERRLLGLVVFTLVVVGGAIIALIYGPEALLTALPCLLAGAGLILVPWLLLSVAEKWRDRMERQEREALAVGEVRPGETDQPSQTDKLS